eukprot:Protomagalhaensia_sp_Gyna_25__1104@NODE_153_length_4806_cov_90_625131_g119_i0_p1_GENE_NODE_153_length_4806_cov_90_625131_g119_i0NODE_153_length_4806_cov_90_625131_g119_i0_p1_ORF_typecomplete_len501_score65_94Tri3/PF07428_11/1_9e50Condensation/PF00668_20/2_9e11AATase/PF07247_12/5_8e09AbiEi_2/PF09952_9/0_0043Neurexophilin/PF06312_12/0_18PapA_C/PF16911_5/0_5_NODE_153_length_4806_cov_90_625131_g119_i015343036
MVVDYSWQQTASHRWERRIDEIELFLTKGIRSYEVSGKIQFTIASLVSLSTSTPSAGERLEQALRDAWLKLRYDQPSLSCWIEHYEDKEKCRRIYQTFQNSEEQDEWLQNTVCVIENGQTGAEWVCHDPPSPQLATLYIIRPPQKDPNRLVRDLVIRARHNIVDGIGLSYVLRNFLSDVSKAYTEGLPKPVFGSEHVRLSPPLRVALGSPEELTKEQQDEISSWKEHNFIEPSQKLSLPYKAGGIMPGAHIRVRRVLSRDSTSSIVKACRNLGVTVTHAVHTAVAIAIRDVQIRESQSRMKKLSLYLLIGERPNCQSPYNTPDHGATVYHSGSGRHLIIDFEIRSQISSTAPVAEEFSRLLPQVQEFYLQVLNDPNHIALVPRACEAITTDWPRDAGSVPQPKFPPHVVFSSLGALDKTIPPHTPALSIDDVWLFSDEVSPGVDTFVQTWDGRLSLSATCNQTWYTEEAIKSFLKTTEEVLLKGLKIDMSSNPVECSQHL